MKNPPLAYVVGMSLDERWVRSDFSRIYKLNGVQFRLYGVRGLKSKEGAWYLQKLHDLQYRRYKGPAMDRPRRKKFLDEAKEWAEKYAEEREWVFVPEARHLMRTTQLPESVELLIELEVLAQRGDDE